jgi:transcription initiation factor TFIIH subunit 1
MFTSKAGAAKTSAKLAFIDDRPKGGLTFQFTATSPQNLADRQALQDYLIPFIAENKQRNTTNIATDANAAQGIGAGAAALAKSQPVASSSTSPWTSRPSTPAPVARATASGPSGNAYDEEEIGLRKRVLAKNSTLKSLHRDLVIAGLVSDEDFWDGRQVGTP